MFLSQVLNRKGVMMTRMRLNLLMLFFGVITPMIVLSAAAYEQQPFEDEVRKRAAILKEKKGNSSLETKACTVPASICACWS